MEQREAGFVTAVYNRTIQIYGRETEGGGIGDRGTSGVRRVTLLSRTEQEEQNKRTGEN